DRQSAQRSPLQPGGNLMKNAAIATGTALFGCVLFSAPVPQDGDYVFVKDTNRRVAIIRGETFLIGRLTEDGIFLLEYQVGINQPTNMLPGGIINFFGKQPVPVYEYRSDRLIRGEM